MSATPKLHTETVHCETCGTIEEWTGYMGAPTECELCHAKRFVAFWRLMGATNEQINYFMQHANP